MKCNENVSFSTELKYMRKRNIFYQILNYYDIIMNLAKKEEDTLNSFTRS